MVSESPAAPIARSTRRRRPHILDELLEERAPNLVAHWSWPIVRPPLLALLDYDKARRLIDALAPRSGRDCLELVSRLLDLRIEVVGLERLPREGRILLVLNHPTGIGDAIAIWDAVKARRPDVMGFANADAHRIAPRFRDVLIPVEWIVERRTLESNRLTLTATRKALAEERPIVVFPAGRISRRSRDGKLSDPPWVPGVFTIARKFAAPVLPIHLAGPPSRLFHFFHRFSSELRDITMFHELFDKRRATFKLTIGEPVAPSRLPADSVEAAAAMKAYVEEILPRDPDRGFA
ncbi:MAG: GNAT family N-acetyltransferase [Caulobacteraceae bacterium]